MKNNVLKFFVLLFSLFLCLNGKAQVDTKYLAGAVPEKDDKVVFSDTFSLPGMTQNQIYERALLWAEANYNTESSRVAYIDKEKGIISCKGETEAVFSSGALSLDRTFINYQFNIFCKDGLCTTELKSIYFLYNVSNKKEPEKYKAEEWITDKEAVNKDKLYRSNGKFRIKTIDMADDIYNSLGLTITTGEADIFTDKERNKIYSRQQASTNVTSVKKEPAVSVQTIPATRVTEEAKEVSAYQNTEVRLAAVSTDLPADMSSYKKTDPEKIPGNIIKMLNNDWMLITAGNDSKFNMMTASWGGIGVLWGKPVAICFINPARYTYQIMESDSTYTLSFYTEAYRDALKYCGSNSGKNVDKVQGSGLTPITLPSGAKAFSEAWMILECKKMLGQQITADSVFDQKAKGDWSKSQFHKVYIGEILNVWVK